MKFILFLNCIYLLQVLYSVLVDTNNGMDYIYKRGELWYEFLPQGGPQWLEDSIKDKRCYLKHIDESVMIIRNLCTLSCKVQVSSIMMMVLISIPN